MQLPTSWSPYEEMKIDGLTIKPSQRVFLSFSDGHKIGSDTVEVTIQGDNPDEWKTWVMFHTFIFQSGQTMKAFVQEGMTDYEVEVLKEPLGYQIDYSDVLSYVYWLHKTALVKSYPELYQHYLELSDKKRNLIANFLNDFTLPSHVPGRVIADPAYWQLMVYFSVIEAIIGQQSHCSNQPECEECGRKMLHHPKSQTQYFTDRLMSIITDEGIAKSYLTVIEAVRQRIRHSTVHVGLVPTAQRTVRLKAGTEVFDVKRAVEEYDKDATALFALTIACREVARYLLLNHVFGLPIFPELRPLKEMTIKAGSPNSVMF